MRSIAVLWVVTLFGVGPVHSQTTGARPPCGADGRECQCGEWGWQWSYTRYDLDESNRIVVDYMRSPECKTREDCARRHAEWLQIKNRSVVEWTGWAESVQRSIDDARRYGDKEWESDAQENLARHEAMIRLREKEARSAVPPHCSLEKVRKQIEAEFPDALAPTDGDWVSSPLPKNQVGVMREFTLSERGRAAMIEMRENWSRANALTVTTGSIPFLLPAVTAGDVDEWLFNLATFDWGNWASTMDALDRHLTPFVKKVNHNICAAEYLYWSQPGRASEPERQFWGHMCRNMR